MTDVCVIGAGILPFARHDNMSLSDLAVEAAYRAIKDANIAPGIIETGYFANVLGSRLFGDSTVGQSVFASVGVAGGPILNIENACASGSTAFYLAFHAIKSGLTEYAIVVGAEKMCVSGMGLLNSSETDIETKLGLVTPASFAMRAKRYMYEFNMTREELAQVTVKNRKHAAANPLALFQTPVTVEEVLGSSMIADPLTKLQCCPMADGAAALVLAKASSALAGKRPIRINSVVLNSGIYNNPIDLIRWETDRRSCQNAYDAAALGPDDLDLVECHDPFTIAEILHYEALELCPAGMGAALLADGATSLGGRIPVNVSGGLIGRGHPLAATGVAQIVEIVAQLRKEAKARQVEDARVGLAHCMGADLQGDARACTVTILSNYD
ncbi:MAG: propanoyl-CoA acyltransferase [Proteobacteria bacterium]|nr:MAG: propanoyl-CoA acyltransferase [Pseudomonadota bacterium]